MFLIFACADGWPSRVPSRLGGGPPTAAANVFKAKTLVGAALGTWELFTSAGAAATQSRQWIATVVSSSVRVHVDVHSFVTYEASAAVSLLWNARQLGINLRTKFWNSQAASSRMRDAHCASGSTDKMRGAYLM